MPKTTRATRRALLLSSVLAAGPLIGGCKTTVIQASTSTQASNQTTTTAPLPIDTPTQLHDIVTLTRGLGNLIANGGAGPALSRITALWAVAARTVGPGEPTLRTQVDEQITIIQNGVKLKRAADADKAARNLEALFATYLQRHPAG